MPEMTITDLWLLGYTGLLLAAAAAGFSKGGQR